MWDAPDGERKTVTALFADIKGSMELMEELDPEEARRLVDPALNLMMDAVHHYGGYVAQSTGDGIFALFGAPVAHEDHPQRALYAALRLQEEMRRYSTKLRAASRSPRRSEHRRGSGPFDRDRRGPLGVHTDRTFDQPGGEDAGARADGLYRDNRRHAQILRGIKG
jgi:class 3 adenylate cyclase